MGIQSTIILTRKDAEQQVVDKILENEHRKIIETYVSSLGNVELENLLESMFDNYMINDMGDINE